MNPVQKYADQEVLKKSIPMTLTYTSALTMMLVLTPLFSRHPKATLAIGGIGGLIILFRLTAAFLDKKGIYLASLYVSAGFWGSFIGWILLAYELGWTSFLAMILTVALCSGLMAHQSPNYRLLSTNLCLILMPSILVNFTVIDGLRGTGLGTFFTAFLALLLIQGRIQNKNILARIQTTFRLMSMVNAVPATLAWVRSDFTYLGVNSRLAAGWKTDPEDFIGKKIGFIDSKSPIVDFSKKLFESSRSQESEELIIPSPEGNRDLFMIGHKYNGESEALILGMDITEHNRSKAEAAVKSAV